MLKWWLLKIVVFQGMVESSKEESASPTVGPLDVQTTWMSNLRWEIKILKK